METAQPVHHEHVPQTQKFVTYLLYAAAGLSVLVLALCAYVLSVYSNVFLWGDVLNPALGLTIFSCILTWIFVAAYFLLPRFAPQLYQKWAILGAFALTAFFWLVSWALLASRVASISFINNGFSGYYGSFNLAKREPKRSSSSTSSFSSSSDYDGYTSKYRTAWKVAAAAAGLGALTWVLIVVALVFFTIACIHHQNSGVAEYEGEPKPMPPAAPGHEMNNYGAPNSATPNPEQQFAHNQQYGAPPQQYDQSAYNQNQAYQQPQQPQHQIPT